MITLFWRVNMCTDNSIILIRFKFQPKLCILIRNQQYFPILYVIHVLLFFMHLPINEIMIESIACIYFEVPG